MGGMTLRLLEQAKSIFAALLRKRRHRKIVDRLNRAYAEPDPDDKRIVAAIKAKFAATIKDPW